MRHIWLLAAILLAAVASVLSITAISTLLPWTEMKMDVGLVYFRRLSDWTLACWAYAMSLAAIIPACALSALISWRSWKQQDARRLVRILLFGIAAQLVVQWLLIQHLKQVEEVGQPGREFLFDPDPMYENAAGFWMVFPLIPLIACGVLQALVGRIFARQPAATDEEPRPAQRVSLRVPAMLLVPIVIIFFAEPHVTMALRDQRYRASLPHMAEYRKRADAGDHEGAIQSLDTAARLLLPVQGRIRMTLHVVYIEKARYLVKIGRTDEALTFLNETIAASRFGFRDGAELRAELTAELPPNSADEQETAIPDSEAGDR